MRSARTINARRILAKIVAVDWIADDAISLIVEPRCWAEECRWVVVAPAPDAAPPADGAATLLIN
jgi:hypothetical protein